MSWTSWVLPRPSSRDRSTCRRISQIIAGERAVTGDTALRFGYWFGTEPQFWLNLQNAYEIRIAEEKAGREIAGLPVRTDAA
jgi:antitoxin HigA-1